MYVRSMERLCMIREVLIVVANFCFCSNQFVECCKISTGRIENDCNIHLEVRFPSQLVEVKQIVVLWLLFPRYTYVTHGYVICCKMSMTRVEND